MEEELAERVYFHTPSAELFRALFNTGNINLDQLCGCMKNRKNEPGAPNYLAFVEFMLTQNKLRSFYLQYLSNVEPSVYSAFLAEAGVAPSNFEAELAEIEQKIIDNGVSAIYSFFVAVSQDCPSHIADFQNQLIGDWREDYRQELSSIPDFNELFQNTSLDNFNFPCAEFGFNYLFSLLNSDNSANLRSTLINQVQEAGISTLQQKKNWLIDWYFSNDPMGSTYLATLRNSALVSTYQTNPGMLYGTPFATGMENYFQKIKNYFGQSMFDQLVTEFAQQSNLYVDELRIDDFNIYGSSRLGVYEANKTISRRVARDLNNDNQITNNEYEVETPEEVLYLFSSYQLERGSKRYELANHLGNVLTVISDKKTANFIGTTFNYFSAERISATDYSPFGAPLFGRTWNGGEYRFGFNGKELDSEGMGGGGSTYDYGFRIYNAQLGRFLSVDPLTASFPWYTPFQFAGNKPIIAMDLDGLEELIVIRWYDNQNRYSGETVFRIENEDYRIDKSPKKAIFLKWDVRIKVQIHRLFQDRTDEWRSVFFELNSSGKPVGMKPGIALPVPFRNFIDYGRNDKLREMNLNNKRSILFGISPLRVYFNQNSSQLQMQTMLVDNVVVDNQAVLHEAVVFTNNNPDYKAFVYGSANTDGQETGFDNQDLSQRRANSTVQGLVQSGIDPSDVTNTGGVGASTRLKGSTNQGTQELNRSATIEFIVPR